MVIGGRIIITSGQLLCIYVVIVLLLLVKKSGIKTFQIVINNFISDDWCGHEREAANCQNWRAFHNSPLFFRLRPSQSSKVCEIKLLKIELNRDCDKLMYEMYLENVYHRILTLKPRPSSFGFGSLIRIFVLVTI